MTEEKNPREYYQEWFVDEFIDAFSLNFRLGSVVKYIFRAGKKDNNIIKDLNKALDYLQRELDVNGFWIISRSKKDKLKLNLWLNVAIEKCSY